MANFVWMCRYIQGENVYMYEEFGGDRGIACGSYKDLMLDSEGKKWRPLSRPPGMTQLKDFPNFCSSRHEDDIE